MKAFWTNVMSADDNIACIHRNSHFCKFIWLYGNVYFVFWDITYLILESRKVVFRFALDKLLLM